MIRKQATLIGAAVATALGSAAYALPPANWTDGTITSIYYAGGGSAEVQAIYTAVYNCLVSSTIDVYSDQPATALHTQSLNYMVVSGTVGTNTACGTAGTNVGFMYKYSGGSYPNGPAAQATSLNQTLSYPSTSSLALATAYGSFAGTQTSVNPKYGFTDGTLVQQNSDWGISDEEAGNFAYAWNSSGKTGGLTNPSANNAGQAVGYLNPFGIAVTANVFAQKTKFSRAEIASIYQLNSNHGITSWGQLNGDNGSAITGLGGIMLLDRGVGSGTKAGANAYFLNYPANTAALPPYSVTAGGSRYTTSCTNSGSGGLCVTGTLTGSFQDVKEASSVAIVDDLNQAQTAGLGAIGALGLEFPPLYGQQTTGTNTYDFVAIDGNFPDSGSGTTDNVNSPTTGSTTSYSNVVKGVYDFAYQVGLQSTCGGAAPFLPTCGGGGAALAPFQAAVYAFLSSVNVSSAHTGTSFPQAAEGVLLDVTTSGGTSAGTVEWTRGGTAKNAPGYEGTVTAPNPVTINSQH